jgi:divalent metal cation (Fe/Co/Zn/Cd) transporter
MSKWGRTATWLMLVTAIVVFLAAVFVIGSTIGRLFILGAIELSIPQIGIICAGVTSVSIFLRCVKKLEGRVENECV